jgi:anti-anti-sigma factor
MRLADLHVELEQGFLTARLAGEIDASNADELGQAIAKAMPNDAFGAVLDLTRIDYLDSAGIHLIYRLREDLRSRGQLLRLVIPAHSVVGDALRLAGVEGSVAIDETAERALAQLRASVKPR